MSTAVSSERDVVFTPFMLRVRDAVTASTSAAVTLHWQPSSTTSVAVAVDEWSALRSRAEHVVAEANAMLDAGVERIALDDEYGTGHLAFVLRWRGRACRLLVHENASNHTARVEVATADGAAPHKPSDLTFLEDLTVSLLSPQDSGANPDERPR